MANKENLLVQWRNLTKEKQIAFLKALEKSAQDKRTKSPSSPQSIQDLLHIKDVLRQLTKPGSVIEFPQEEVIHFDNPLSAVKTIRTRFMSSIDTNSTLLHRIHMQIRGLNTEKRNGVPQE